MSRLQSKVTKHDWLGAGSPGKLLGGYNLQIGGLLEKRKKKPTEFYQEGSQEGITGVRE
jgi:hypothetical protein